MSVCLSPEEVRDYAPKKKKNAKPEAELLKRCLMLLKHLGIWFLRINVGGVAVGRRFIRFAKPGTADVLCIIGGSAIWVEMKSKVGKQSADQIQFQQEVEAAGALYWLIRDDKDLERRLKEFRSNHAKLSLPVRGAADLR